MKEIEGYLVAIFPVKNQDAMMRVLTSEGIIAFFARGIMNYKHDAISTTPLFNYSRFFLYEGSQRGLSLRQGQLLLPVKMADESLASYACLELMSEIINHVLIDHEPQYIYSFLKSSLQALSQGISAITVAILFLAKTLTIIGLQPILNQCVVCGSKTGITSISLEEGGFICQTCFNPKVMKRYDKDVLITLRLLFITMNRQLFEIQIKDETSLAIVNLFNQHLENHLGKSLKSISILTKAYE